MKLAIAQMVLGAAISLMGVEVFLLPLGLYFVVMGLAVLGCGIAQFLKARGEVNKQPLPLAKGKGKEEQRAVE